MQNIKESKFMEYGLVAEYEHFDVWFSSITDTLDGFVLRSKISQEILEVYPLEN